MTPHGALLLRRGLVVLFVAVTAAVIFNMGGRKDKSTSVDAMPGDARASAAPPGATRFGDLVFRKFRDGRQILLLKAGAMVSQGKEGMQLRSVEATIPRVQDGKEETLTIRADECLYQQASELARFDGNVRISTSDGIELDAPTMTYDGEARTARTDDMVAFRRGEVSGTSRGVRYDDKTGRAVLGAEVRIRSASQGEAPVELASGTGEFARDTRQIFLDGGVQIVQGADRLSAARMKLDLSEDLRSLTRLVAVDDVVVQAAGSGGLGAVSGELSGKGARRLQARKLDVWFAEGGRLREVTAVKNAELVGEPPPGSTERRRVAANVLFFRFDAEGRLAEVEGQGECEVSSGPPRRQGRGRRITARQMNLTTEPQSGALVRSRFAGNVAFDESGRKGSADVVVQDEGAGLVHMSGSPKLLEVERGSELSASEITIHTKDGSLSARGNVRHTVPQRGGGKAKGASGPFFAGQAVEATAGSLEYDPQSRRATYREKAHLRSGENVVQGDEVAVDESAAGQRTLTARGHVTCHLMSRGGTEGRKADKIEGGTEGRKADKIEDKPVPIDVTSGQMRYDEAARRIVYETDVRMTRGDIQTSSPKATVTLGGEGDRLESLVAGEPVEVTQNERKATGRQATYTPADETVAIVGEKVVLSEPTRTVQGKRVLFRLGREQVSVEGLDETRTETVIHKQKGKTAP